MAQNAAVTKLKSQIVTPMEEKKLSPIEILIEQNKSKLEQLLPSNMSIQRLMRIIISVIKQNPKLASCTQASLLGAIFQSALLGLEPNVEGQAYIIPYSNTRTIKGKRTKVTEAQFQIGYKGYIELFYRYSAALSIDMHTVYKNDVFEYSYGTEPVLKHCPILGDRGEAIAYYAVARLSNGGSVFKVMTKQECLAHAKEHSKTYITMEWSDEQNRYVKCEPHFTKDSPWVTDFNAMCKKTVLIQLAKVLPKSIELQRAIAMDNTTKTTIQSDMYSLPDETDWSSENVSNSVVLPPTEAGE